MKKIVIICAMLLVVLTCSFAEKTKVVTGVVPETLFVNEINNVLVFPDAPIVEIEETYYMPISAEFLSRVGKLPIWEENGTKVRISGLSQAIKNVKMEKKDPYLVNYERPISVVPCSPVEVLIEGNNGTCSVMATYKNQWSEVWYVPLTAELVKAMDWTYYELGNYGDFLYLYEFTQEDEVAFTAYKKELEAMAKYMTIINKRLPIERAAYYVQLVQKTSQKYDVDEQWILAIMWQESWYDESCTYINAVGMMQMLKSTGKTMGVTPEQLLDPAINIDVCVKYLNRDRAYFDGDLEKAIHAYNQGSFRVAKNTHRTWYFEEVHEKYGKIGAYIQKATLGS